MYVGINGLKAILTDSHYIEWFLVESINENKSEISLSNNDTFTLNASIGEIFNMVSELEEYALPPINDVVFKFAAINPRSILHVDDEHVVFESTTFENIYENASILVESYQLPFECMF